MKTNKVLKRMLTVLLSAAVFICSTPAIALAVEPEAEGALLADAVVEETVSENSIVEEASSLGSVLEDIVSEDTASAGFALEENNSESFIPEDITVSDKIDDNITPDQALKPGDSVTILYRMWDEKEGYTTVPKGYTLIDDGYNIYKSTVPITETAQGATITLLPPPDIPPDDSGLGQVFCGWASPQGGFSWIEGSVIPLSMLPIDEWSSEYTFTFVSGRHLYALYYDLDGGTFDDEAIKRGVYRSNRPDYFRQGEVSYYKDNLFHWTGKEHIIPPAGAEFLGWSVDGVNIIKDLDWYDWAANGNKVYLKAIYSNSTPQPITHTLTLSGLTDIDQDSLNALQAQGFTVKGDTAAKTFTSTDSKFYLPALSKPGSSFLGWYETGKSPSMASPYVEFDPATSYDISYTASFQEDVSISLRSSLTLYEGQSFGLSATVRPENAVQTVTWANSDSEVVSLTSNTVKARKAGTCNITATSVADPSKTAVCKVTVLKSEVTETDEHGNPIDPGSHAYDEETGEMNIWVAGIDKDGYHYTGKATKPEMHVYNGGKLLREGTDYTLSYKNNTKVSTDVTSDKKKPQVTIKMKGQYSGSKTVYFDILPTPLSELTATEPNLDVTYQLKKKNQIKPVLEYKGTKIKYSKKDFSFKWFETDSWGNATDVESTCIDPGSYAVKVYAGSSGNFTADSSGLQVAKVNVLGKIPISAVKVNGFKSKVPYNNGVAIEQPEMTLTYKSGKILRTLILGEDYTVSYDNNHNIGTATVTYEGMKNSSGNYTGDFAGKITKKYQITGKYALDSSNTKVTLADDSYEFQNAAIKPDVTVTVTATDDNGNPENRTLVNGKDYTVTYKNNKAVAAKDAVNSNGKDIAPQVIIKGKGRYATDKQGMVERFNITKTDLSSLVLTISDKPYSKKAGGYKSTKILFTDCNYRDLKLKAGKDYTIDYTTSDGSETPAPGEIVYVAINAKEGSSYTGNITGEYRITGSMYTDISKAKVVVNPNSKGKTTACAYTGSKVEPGQTDQPGLILTVGSGKSLKTLKQGVDYEILSYHNNIDPSKKATILIRGLGDYRGVRAIKFTISARPVASHWGGVFGW
ncbi:Ig domain-containing protein [Candidatus Saccharibacteria bacterium]|nr:Ig domain-containing protein [Candidatus Saccharibacteria bacterium]